MFMSVRSKKFPTQHQRRERREIYIYHRDNTNLVSRDIQILLKTKEGPKIIIKKSKHVKPAFDNRIRLLVGVTDIAESVVPLFEPLTVQVA